MAEIYSAGQGWSLHVTLIRTLNFWHGASPFRTQCTRVTVSIKDVRATTATHCIHMLPWLRWSTYWFRNERITWDTVTSRKAHQYLKSDDETQCKAMFLEKTPIPPHTAYKRHLMYLLIILKSVSTSDNCKMTFPFK